MDAQVAGISGDMLLCALVDMGADRSRVVGAVRGADESSGRRAVERMEFVRAVRRGTAATGLVLELGGDVRGRAGKALAGDVAAGCAGAGLSGPASEFAASAAGFLVAAESAVHGAPAGSVRLHEAAGFDTIADIVGTAAALEDLGLLGEEAVCTPVAVGGGTVSFSHGVAPNPAPAVLEALRDAGIAVRGTPAGRELATPTGACLLRALAPACVRFYPEMTARAVGYGAGAADPEGFANVLRLVRGERTAAAPPPPGAGMEEDEVAVLETNLDDVTGEELAHAMEALAEAGALDVTAAPAVGKKGRPAHAVAVMCEPDSAARLAGALMEQTGTLGVRVRVSRRLKSGRRSGTGTVRAGGAEFEVSLKTGLRTGRTKAEADDVAAAARAAGVPFREAARLAGGRRGTGGGGGDGGD